MMKINTGLLFRYVKGSPIVRPNRISTLLASRLGLSSPLARRIHGSDFTLLI